MIPYTVKSDQQILDEKLAPAGKHKFEVTKCEDKTSKSGNEMTMITLKVINNGKNVIFNDFIMAGNDEKLKDFAYSLGLDEQYNDGFFDNLQTIGKAGFVDIIIDAGGKNPEYPNATNKVKKYIRLNAGEAPVTIDIKLEDEVPF